MKLSIFYKVHVHVIILTIVFNMLLVSVTILEGRGNIL